MSCLFAAPSPSLTRHSGQADVPFYLDLRIVLPFFISCLVILAAVVGIYYCWNKSKFTRLYTSFG